MEIYSKYLIYSFMASKKSLNFIHIYGKGKRFVKNDKIISLINVSDNYNGMVADLNNALYSFQCRLLL